MVHHPLRWHPACSRISINTAHQSLQTHPQRTFLCIELESTYVVSSYAVQHMYLPIPPSFFNVGHCPIVPLISTTSSNNVLIVLPMIGGMRASNFSNVFTYLTSGAAHTFCIFLSMASPNTWSCCCPSSPNLPT
jgi:hypothetical protein